MKKIFLSIVGLVCLPLVLAQNPTTQGPTKVKGNLQVTGDLKISPLSCSAVGTDGTGKVLCTGGAALPNVGTAGTCGDTTHFCVPVFDVNGRESAWTINSIPSGFTAGGDLGGSPTSQIVNGLLGHSLGTIGVGYPHWNGSTFVWDTPAGGGSGIQYNGSDTLYLFVGPDSIVGDDSHIFGALKTVTSFSCTSGSAPYTCTVNTSSAHGLTTGKWVTPEAQMTGWPGVPSPYAAWSTPYDLFQITAVPTSTSLQFQTSWTSASGASGSGGTIEDASYFLPVLTSNEPFFNGHGTIDWGLPTGSTIVSLDSNYATVVHPKLTAWQTVHPGSKMYVIITGGRNDLQTCTSVATLETDLLNVAASAHTDGAEVIWNTITPSTWNNSTFACPGVYFNMLDLNNWSIAQIKVNASSGTRYFDHVVDQYATNNDLSGPLVTSGGGINDLGRAVYARVLNDAMAHQDSAYKYQNRLLTAGPVGGTFTTSGSPTYVVPDDSTNFGISWWSHARSPLLGLTGGNVQLYTNHNAPCIGTSGYNTVNVNCITSYPSAGLAASTSSAWRAPVFGDVVGLWSSCTSGYLKFDGTCSTATGGLADPGANGVMKRTSLNVTSAAAFADIVAMWASGSCTSGYLKFDGTCTTPGGGGTVTSSGSPASADIAAFTSSTDITKATATQVNTLIKTLTGCNTATYLYSPQSGTCVAPSGGGSTTLYDIDNFTSGTSPGFGLGWTMGSAGSGNAITTQQGSTYPGHNGVIKIDSGTNSNGWTQLVMGNPGNGAGPFDFDTTTGKQSFTAEILAPLITLQGVKMGFTYRSLWFDTRYIAFECASANAVPGDWYYQTYDGTTLTSTDSGVSCNNVWHQLEIAINNTAVTFYIDGASVGTGTAPATTGYIAAIGALSTTATTNRFAYVDWAALSTTISNIQ